MSNRYRMSERRRDQYLTFIERRKGKLWMYGEMAVFAVLAMYLASLLLG